MLIDTSIWVDYFHGGDTRVSRQLEAGVVRTHPLVIGELACGRFRDRARVFALLTTLPTVTPVAHDEALAFLEHHRLGGAGLGWIDVHLLASARLSAVGLWTNDRRLADAGRRIGLTLTHG